MADISRINIGETTYDLKDIESRTRYPISKGITGLAHQFTVNNALPNSRFVRFELTGESIKENDQVTSLGDNGLKIIITDSSSPTHNVQSLTITTGLPLMSCSGAGDWLDFNEGYVYKNCYYDESDNTVKQLIPSVKLKLTDVEINGYNNLKFYGVSPYTLELKDSNDQLIPYFGINFHVFCTYMAANENGQAVNDISAAFQTQIDENIMQLSTLPTASSELLGKIHQFVGTTTSSYTNGYFYKCVEGSTPGTYEWQAVNVQAGGSGGDQLVWLGTRAEHTAAEQAGTLPADAIIGIEDEQSSGGGGGAQIDDEHVSTTTTYSSSKIESLFELPLKTFGGCTDEELVEIIAKADAGELNPSNYWAVGDTRRITLPDISQGDLGNTIAARTFSLVIYHVGLYRDENNKIVNFVVGPDVYLSSGKINTTNTYDGSWKECARRYWCNNDLYNAFPSNIRSIFKKFKTITAIGPGSSGNEVETTLDYFAYLAMIEHGINATYTENGSSKSYEQLAEKRLLTTFDYFLTSANREMGLNSSTSGTRIAYRSPNSQSGSEYPCLRYYKGSNTSYTYTMSADYATGAVVFFGCI
jgi:hypothetical protein